MKYSIEHSCDKAKKNSMPGCPKEEMFAAVKSRRKAFIDTFFHLFTKYLMSSFHMPGAILGAQNTEMSKTSKILYLHGAPILMRRKDTDKKCWLMAVHQKFTFHLSLENEMLNYISQFPLELDVFTWLNSHWWNMSGNDLCCFLNRAFRLWLCRLYILFPFTTSWKLDSALEGDRGTRGTDWSRDTPLSRLFTSIFLKPWYSGIFCL